MKHNWQDLQEQIVEWRNEKLKDKGVTLQGTLEHLVEEVEDLKENPYNIINIADVFILMMGICDDVAFSMDEVLEAVAAKVAINSSRLWGDADEKGIVRHIEETKF